MKSSLSSRLSEAAALTGEKFPALLGDDYRHGTMIMPPRKAANPAVLVSVLGCWAALSRLRCLLPALWRRCVFARPDDLPHGQRPVQAGKPSCHAAYGEALALRRRALLPPRSACGLCRPAEREANEGIRILAGCAGASGIVGGQQLDLAGKRLSYGTK